RYPGRGLVLAGLADGPAAAYLLTGRSQASRSRRLEIAGDGRLRVRAVDAPDDDPLRHYAAAVEEAGWTVLGNGSQVTPMAGDLAAGDPFAAALARHRFEPDPPIHTPRITLAQRQGEPHALFGSALRAEHLDRPCWLAVEVPLPEVGDGYLLTTYAGGPAPTAQRSLLDGEVGAAGRGELADLIWDALDPALRVAVAVRSLAGPAAWEIRQSD
ncbi:MAG TPA: IMP cyclohydrolase, partial [Candidatus Dormibacteraeota bacterium]|nr:IMP cyclohydrolase [Candidatus Dormibacteraeota bacterium]